ncbi:ATPase, Ca++ transporting, ubiquitous [Auriculariales sp. MPI-PUGE-AT-0066]|nr:ATPase, Ca++ transporting, ubiquitous [Auriculariales sp. MPI-PUGE-AT-0066]
MERWSKLYFARIKRPIRMTRSRDQFSRTIRSASSLPAHVAKNVELYGKNELPEEEGTPLWQLVLEQFKDQLVLPDRVRRTLVILLILVANAAVGVIQEFKAEAAIDALREFAPDEAKVLRSGRILKVHASELVPGDIVSIAVGDKIPADCRLLSITSSSFRVDQVILTGESQSVSKSLDVVPDPKAVKQDQTNMLFSGTTVVNGTAHALVVRTGQKTAIGHIHQSISSQINEKTPLKKKLDDFGETLAKVISVICVLVWLLNIRHFTDPAHGGMLKGAIYYLKIAVALAVAAIPEGLAAVITACLALGTQKMAQRNAIVRNLPSVETLGCTNVICSNKTGTLTTNQMSVSSAQFTVASDINRLEEYSVEGTTFAPLGAITSESGQQLTAYGLTEPILRLAEIGAVCNDSKIVFQHDKNAYANVGEPTEAALRVLTEKIGCTDGEVTKSLPSLTPKERVSAVNDHYERVLPGCSRSKFSRDRKMMSVLVKGGPLGAQLLVKGARKPCLSGGDL